MASGLLDKEKLDAELSRFDSDLPLEKASTMPSGWYLKPEFFALEKQAIFHSGWQYIARLDQLPSPGDFITVDLAGEPVLIVRDQNGTIRAMANVCRHKAARVACAESGNTKLLQCRYHGWSYNLEGDLKGAPEFDGVCDFNKSEIRLPAYEIDSYGPFLFVNLKPGSKPLKEYLKPFTEMHSPECFSKLKFVVRKEYIIECNWKVFIDNYLDGGYHVTVLHPGLSGVVNYKDYRTEVFEELSVQISPLKQGSVSNVRSGDNAYYWWLFPNFMVNLYEGYMDTNLVLPIGVDKCKVIFDFYFENWKGPESEALIEESITVAEQVQQEDISISEDVFRGLHSSTYDTGRLSFKREIGILHFHRLVAKSLKAFEER